VVEGESVTAVTVGSRRGVHTMEDEEVEDREEDEESVGEEEGEGDWGGEGNEEEVEGAGAWDALSASFMT